MDKKEKNKFKEPWKKFIEWYKEDPEEREKEKEFDKFLEEVEKRAAKIPAAQKAETHEARAQVMLMFENAYTQRKITEANQTMGRATIILAIATIALVITSAYGAQGLEKAFNETTQVFIVLFFIGIILWALGILGKITKFLFKLIWRRR